MLIPSPREIAKEKCASLAQVCPKVGEISESGERERGRERENKWGDVSESPEHRKEDVYYCTRDRG